MFHVDNCLVNLFVFNSQIFDKRLAFQEITHVHVSLSRRGCSLAAEIGKSSVCRSRKSGDFRYDTTAAFFAGCL